MYKALRFCRVIKCVVYPPGLIVNVNNNNKKGEKKKSITCVFDQVRVFTSHTLVKLDRIRHTVFSTKTGNKVIERCMNG